MVYTATCVQVEDKGQIWMSSLILSALFFEAGFSSELGIHHLARLSWQNDPQIPHPLHHQKWAYMAFM